jgi:hypothetical protein
VISFVIASEAKQSSFAEAIQLCCGKAGLLRRYAPRNDEREGPAPLIEIKAGRTIGHTAT